MRLKPGLTVLWRNDQEIQIGCDNRIACRLAVTERADYYALKALEHETSPAAMRRIIQRVGGHTEHIAPLIEQLAQAGVLVTNRQERSAQWAIPPAQRLTLAPEADSRALVEPDGWLIPALRAGQRVSIYGLSRTGANVAMGLAAAGIGALQLHDPEPVTPRDLGMVYQKSDLGQPRQQAITNHIRQQNHTCEPRTQGTWTRPDAAIMTDYQVTDPHRASQLAVHNIPHLALVVKELDITCGPWAGSTETACTWCVELWCTETDPGWATVATQQLNQSALARRGEDACLASLAATLAVAQTLTALAGHAPASQNALTRFTLPNYTATTDSVAIHPQCRFHRAAPRNKPNSENPKAT